MAVTDQEHALTYGELEARSNALSTYLRSQELGADAVVALCMERSIAQVICALAVMKAGAAYCPLDPSQPAARLLFELRDARVDIVLTAGDVAGLAAFDEAQCVRLRADGSLENSSRLARTNSPPSPAAATERASPQSTDLAYVIYTSGSTGRPKGVEITHAGLTNLTAWQQAAFHLEPADRASHISAVGFDAAVWEVWPYLSVGASVHIADDTIARDPRLLADWLIANAITVAFVATPMAERLIDLDYPPDTALRCMLTGADTLRRYPPASLPFALYNNYGPTEATVVATSGRIEPGAGEHGLPSIGRPIDNTEIYILNEDLERQVEGAEGEICIAGVGLARGYRGSPDLGAQKFVRVAFDAEPPIRIYRTGDRGRRLEDGRLVFLGRIDEQVQIRGFRVEPVEIEAALNAHRGVLESAVIAREFGPGDKRLVAYVVPNPGQRLATGEMQTFLAARLPAYMIPSAFIELSGLPLTSNGKVDRTELRTREMGPTLRADAYVAPRTMTEQRLMHIVAPLLKLERVSVEDNFFMLGGHSLLGTQLIARLRDTFGVKIGLRVLFESPTLSALALEVERLVLERLQAAENDGRRSREFVPERSAAPIRKRGA